MEPWSKRAIAITLWGNHPGSPPSWVLYGHVFKPRAAFSSVQVYWSYLPWMVFLEKIKLPVYVWLHCTLEVLFHLVNIRSFYNYLWLGFQWLDWFVPTKTTMGPGQKCRYNRCWVCKECSYNTNCLEYSSQHLASSLWVSCHEIECFYCGVWLVISVGYRHCSGLGTKFS